MFRARPPFTRPAFTLPGVTLACGLGLGLASLAPTQVLAAERPVAVGALDLTRRIVRGADTPGEAVAGYLRVSNRGGASDALVGAACDCASRIEFHRIRGASEGGGMATEAALDAPAHGRLEVRPGSPLHLMLIDYDPSRAIDGQVRVRLTFRDAGLVVADFALTQDSRSAWAAFD